MTVTGDAAETTTGLTEAEAAKRLAERATPHEQGASRSYRSIAIANTFTIFNLILAIFGAMTIAFGNPKDALFLGILVADGTLLQVDGLALDESNLTGESEPVVRGVGDPVLSGSFAVEGAGTYEAT